jgi:hypothetical protein
MFSMTLFRDACLAHLDGSSNNSSRSMILIAIGGDDESQVVVLKNTKKIRGLLWGPIRIGKRLVVLVL